MAKSSGNVLLIEDLVERGFDPLSFRYLCLTVRYRHRMNFTFSSLRASEKALTNLRNRVWDWKSLPPLADLPAETEEWRTKFWDTVDNDLDLPGALSLTWNIVKSELPGQAKLDLLLDFDRVFGLDLDKVPTTYDVPQTLLTSLQQRSTLRTQEDYSSADSLRSSVLSQGYLLEDTAVATRIRPKTLLERHAERWPSLSSSREVESLVDQPSELDYTFILNAYNYVDDVQRCVTSMLQCAEGRSAEVIVVDNGSTDGTADWLEEFQSGHPNVRVFHCDHVIGDAAGKNIGLKQSRGKHIIIMDASTEVVGDLLTPVQQRLADDSVGIFGPYGLSTDDMRHFHEEVEAGEADAIQAYCMAFCREAVQKVGLMHEGFRFYRNLDIDYSFQFKEKGYRIVADSTLPLVRHEHRQWTELDDNQRDELSRKNFGRFLRRWGHRPDLLITADGHAFNTGFHH